jgi:hypothetical protein
MHTTATIQHNQQVIIEKNEGSSFDLSSITSIIIGILMVIPSKCTVDFLRLPNPSISVHTVAPEILVPIKKSINAITVMVKKKDVEDDGEQYNNTSRLLSAEKTQAQ